MRVRAFATAVIVLSAAAFQACSSDTSGPDGGDPPDFGDDVVITLTASTFSPKEVTIDAGERVHWYNSSGVLHNVTPDDPDQEGVWSAFSSSASNPDGSYTFTVAGQVYEYHCTLHVGMTGKITVRPAT